MNQRNQNNQVNQWSLFVFFFCFSSSLFAQLPQKFDSLYKTVYAKDFCKLIQKHPDIVLLDVRTPGEFSDTSQYNSLNMGHLKGAVNMEIDTIKKNIAVMNPYRDKTLVIYCSHSQRSRRVSKLLSENGFTDFYNLNGGMSSLNQLNENEFPCKNEWIVSPLGYKNVSNTDAVNLIKNQRELVILDVRPVAQFTSKDSLPENNIGKIKGAINIPFATLRQRAAELENYKNAPILVYAASGDGDGARAAAQLVSMGFTKVYHLLAGIHELVISQEQPNFFEPSVAFQLLDTHRAVSLLKNEPELKIYDTRSKSEFENRDKLSWRNLGNIKNAVNIDQSGFDAVTLPADKKSPILIYGHGEAFKFAGMLSDKGYKNVYLMEGLYDFMWSSFNVENCKDARQFLVNHEGLY